jgi:hypothetical protein
VGLEGESNIFHNNPQPHTWLWIRPNFGLVPILALILSKLQFLPPSYLIHFSNNYYSILFYSIA